MRFWKRENPIFQNLNVSRRHVFLFFQEHNRKIEHINGICLDKTEWISATTGWREVQLNHSIKGQIMTMGGQIFHRGIGTHAFSRIAYKRPGNHDMFAATIGCDQKALVGSLVSCLLKRRNRF